MERQRLVGSSLFSAIKRLLKKRGILEYEVASIDRSASTSAESLPIQSARDQLKMLSNKICYVMVDLLCKNDEVEATDLFLRKLSDVNDFLFTVRLCCQRSVLLPARILTWLVLV